MKRIIVLVSILFFMTARGFGQCPWPPGGGNNNTPSPPTPSNTPLDDVATSGGISCDPNEIIGPMGYDSVRWVSINDVLNYTILFENDPEFATANAQKVDVRFRFEDKALMRGFGLGTYGFANMSWEIENNPAAYQNRLDLKDSMYIFVDLTAGVDVVKQQAFWTFNSIDPETGWNPWQVDRGMLPVNDSTHVGEGFVKFQLKPNEALQTGDTISIAANIVFDQNDTIATNRWCVTIDAGMPTSKVKGRKDSKNEHLYHLTVTAADDENGSGLKRVVLYQANNFGIYEEYAVCPLDTVIDFTAELGHTYRFITLAEDNVGNLEPLKEVPDLEINANAAPTDILLSDSLFQDDILAGGFIAELTSVDVETNGTFTYALAEGEGAVHNDLFQISGSQLQAKNTFKCAEDSIYKIRISTTDEGGKSYAEAFTLTMRYVLERPEPDTLAISICEGEYYEFAGRIYEKPGTYRYTVSNDYMCDSVYILQLTVLPQPEPPTVTIKGTHTLVSSAAKGNQWFRADGMPVAGATEQEFTPTEEGIYYVSVSNGACFSAPSVHYRTELTDETTLTLDLPEGWSWMSSNLGNEEYRDIKAFIQPIEEYIECLQGYDTYLMRQFGQGLTGDLTTLSPEAGYLVQTNGAIAHSWTGNVLNLQTAPIILKEGWNWIGYMPVYKNSLTDALDSLTPTEGDVIKGYEAFAIYENGKWRGTLTEMTPGYGYMYYAHKETSFCYPDQRVFAVSEVAKANGYTRESTAPWKVCKHAYPYTMTMIADVWANGQLSPEGIFTIGAFVDDECRGIGEYVGGKLFMTIYGDLDNAAELTFKAYDNATLNVYEIEEKAIFANAMIGTMGIPQRLTIKGDVGIDVQSSEYVIYPNPVRHTLYINGDISRLNTVSVIGNNGAVVAQTEEYTASGLNVSHLTTGTYVVVLETGEKVIVKRILKVE